ncbi:MAG: BrnA antitoxin family protein [Bryobacteraceae bacterium]
MGRAKEPEQPRRAQDKKRAELRRLAKRPDAEIDLSDIPEIRQLPSDAVIGRFYRPRKQSVTIRLDADVLAWLKASGEGYQTRVNTYLRQLMAKQRAS